MHFTYREKLKPFQRFEEFFPKSSPKPKSPKVRNLPFLDFWRIHITGYSCVIGSLFFHQLSGDTVGEQYRSVVDCIIPLIPTLQRSIRGITCRITNLNAKCYCWTARRLLIQIHRIIDGDVGRGLFAIMQDSFHDFSYFRKTVVCMILVKIVCDLPVCYGSVAYFQPGKLFAQIADKLHKLTILRKRSKRQSILCQKSLLANQLWSSKTSCYLWRCGPSGLWLGRRLDEKGLLVVMIKAQRFTPILRSDLCW